MKVKLNGYIIFGGFLICLALSGIIFDIELGIQEVNFYQFLLFISGIIIIHKEIQLIGMR